MNLVPTASQNERIRSIIVECWKSRMPFIDAVSKLRAAGFGSEEIMEYQEWSKTNPMADDIMNTPPHLQRKD